VCDACRHGDFVGCTDQPWTGAHVDGGYAEYAYARASGLVRIPETLSATEAAPLLCAGFTTYNALRKGAARFGELVAVQGIGGLGHLGIQYARRMGLDTVAIARGQEKRALAEQLGAEHYIDSVAEDAGAALQRLGGAAVVVATAAGGDLSALTEGLAHGGRLVVVGASDEPIRTAPTALLFRDIRILGSLTGTSVENEENLAFAVRQGIRAVNEEEKLEHASVTFDRMMTGAARFRMVLTV
jgi:propanol-preferring alcohol dehydrogenase